MNAHLPTDTTRKESQVPIITLLHLTVEGQHWPALLDIYQGLTPDLLRQQPELLLSLLGEKVDAHNHESLLIVSHWSNYEVYHAWESDPIHRAQLRPLVEAVAGLYPETFVRVG